MSVGNQSLELWKRYSETKDHALREKLIIEYAQLVKYVAGRMNVYFCSNVDYDDLVSYGVFGLIDAIDKFDYKKGVKFETYASLRIRGAIIDSVRDLDWIPRSLRQKSKELERTFSELENTLGRTATDEEVAVKLGVSMEDYFKLISEVNLNGMLSLEDYLEQNYEIGIERKGHDPEEHPELSAEISEMKDILAEAVSRLPDKEALVISLYYFEEMTLKEISAVMKVSESRISQLHTKALLRMRGKMTKHRSLLE